MSIDYEYLHDPETRETDYATGGEKGVKLTQVGALDPVVLLELGRVAGMGADKYSAFNYLKGFDWSKAYNAMQRHSGLFWAGEDRDAESGLPHILHAAWMAMALASFYLRGLGTDDRPPRLGQSIYDEDWGQGEPEDWVQDMTVFGRSLPEIEKALALYDSWQFTPFKWPSEEPEDAAEKEEWLKVFYNPSNPNVEYPSNAGGVEPVGDISVGEQFRHCCAEKGRAPHDGPCWFCADHRLG